MALKILALEGLNNAKLCSMVEPVLCSVEGVNSAQIDYLSQRLTMDISGRPTEDAVNDVMELLKKTFPDVRIRFSDAAVFKQPKLNTTPYHSAEPSEDDYYIEDDYDEEPAPTPEPSIPWTQRLRERAATLGTQEILQVIFWTSVGLSLLFLLMSGSWRDSGTAHPYLSAMSFFFAIFSSLFMGENARCDSWLIRAAAVVSTLAIFIVGFHAQAVLAFLVYTTGMMFVDAFYNRFDEKTAKELVFFPQSITCIRSDQTLKVAPEEVREGDLLVFEEGEVLPFRGHSLLWGDPAPHGGRWRYPAKGRQERRGVHYRLHCGAHPRSADSLRPRLGDGCVAGKHRPGFPVQNMDCGDDRRRCGGGDDLLFGQLWPAD